ncbi:hypothetical protein OIA45_19850 [Streptomyces chartreusis]|uniref:hypothetical protein n=1 Tax=Streptomyces chartreusis TaxID=1969 RepID=UPI00386A67CC|nr:hypothetical protein OIA45_19850 [Streptomyces chartreusis]
MTKYKPGRTLREWQPARLITHLIQDALDNREGEASRVDEQDGRNPNALCREIF